MNYLLAASLAMAIFYAVYALALRRLTFHGLNRAYLLGALALSLVLPLVKMPLPVARRAPTERAGAAPPKPILLPTDGWQTLAAEPTPAPAGPDWARLGWGLYAAVAVLGAVRLTRRLYRIRQLARQDGEEINDLLVVPTTGGSASFFRLVLLNDAGLSPDERELVLAHEAEHARLRHSALLSIPVALLVVWACQREVLRTDEPTVPTGKVWVIDHPERLPDGVTVLLKVPVEREAFIIEGRQKRLHKFATKIFQVRAEDLRQIKVEHVSAGDVDPDEGKTVARITVETVDTTYRYNASQMALNWLIVDWVAANSTKFLTRVTLKNCDWTTPYAFANGEYDCLIFKLSDAGKLSGARGFRHINVATGKSPVFRLDDREITEEELNRLPREEIAKIQSIGIDEGHVAALEYDERGINGKVFFSTQLNGGVKAKRQPASPKLPR